MHTRYEKQQAANEATECLYMQYATSKTYVKNLILGLLVGSSIDQQPRAFSIASLGRHMQRRFSILCVKFDTISRKSLEYQSQTGSKLACARSK